MEQRRVLRSVIEREEELLELRQARLPRERVEDEEHDQDVLVGQDLPAVPLLRFEDISNSRDELRPEVDACGSSLLLSVRSLMRTIQMRQRKTSSSTGTSTG